MNIPIEKRRDLHLVFSRVCGTFPLPCALHWVGPTSKGDGRQFQVARSHSTTTLL